MIRSSKFCLAMLALATAPANAATYTGTLNGIITSGEFHLLDGYNYDPPLSYDASLTGLPISINFTSVVNYNYLDEFGYIVPKYVLNTISVTVDDPDPNFALLGTHAGVVTNDPNYIGGLPESSNNDFSGNASAGHMLFPPIGKGEQSLDFSFSGASPNAAPLSGSGATSLDYAPPVSIFGHYDVTFQLTDGFVQVMGAPEPESWALMIVGFGGIGAMMRGRRKQGLLARTA
jgi:hypothetical protein